MAFFRRLNRLAIARRHERLKTHTRGRLVLRDYASEYLGLHQSGGVDMWQGLERGMVIVQETFSFPFVGEVVEWDDTRIILKNAVRVLWDGRHGEFAAG